VGFDERDREILSSHDTPEVLEEALRDVDRGDVPVLARERGEVERREARPAPDVEDPLPRGEAGALPVLVGRRAPDAVLEPEPLELVAIGAEDVFLLAHADSRLSFEGECITGPARRVSRET